MCDFVAQCAGPLIICCAVFEPLLNFLFLTFCDRHTFSVLHLNAHFEILSPALCLFSTKVSKHFNF